jgi:hypothetical protein
MSIRTLAAGLGVCAVFLVGSWQPGNANASFIPETDLNRISLQEKGPQLKRKAESRYDRNGGFPRLLLASQRNSSFRASHTRNKRTSHQPGYRARRNNDPRFYRRSRSSGFSNSNLRSDSNRARLSNKRSVAGTRNDRNKTNTIKRQSSRKYLYITPR